MNDKALDVNNTNVTYQPALDEPCIFTGNHRRPVSVHWLAWYIRNNPRTNLMQAYQRGEEVIKLLEEEPLRYMDPSIEPIKFIEASVGNGPKQVSRLEWIIWYRYTHNVGYGSAYHAGVWGELDCNKLVQVGPETKEE
jgi:hypothetical protein